MVRALLTPFLVLFGAGVLRLLVTSFRRPQYLSEGCKALQMRLRLLGLVILAAGMLAAACIYRTTPPETVTNATKLAYNGLSEGDTILFGGKANLYLFEFREWIGGFLHGRMLALTVALGSAAGCLACLLLAHPRLVHAVRAANGSLTDSKGAR
jgi:hypothetical protein